MRGYWKGDIDEVTGSPITFRTYMEANVVFNLFAPITITKFPR